MYPRHQILSLGIATALVAPAVSFAQQSRFELRSGDRVAILGSALADRMQHSGWLETLIHARHPEHRLVCRNLAMAGDEVHTWHRSQDFGSRDEWLRWTQTDVIFAFYGYGESFAGAAGIEKFKADLDAFLKASATQSYSGKAAPRVVLFSPTAQEKTADPNLPDPSANNANLELYTKAMAEVAKANGTPFVDLFAPTKKLFADAAAKGESLTVNGHYLTEAGDQALSGIIAQALFGEGKAPETASLAKLREAVLEKNHQWHQRYRTIDGYNVYGGRSRLAFTGKLPDGTETPKISNNEVMQREMQQRDVMTANRDARVWAVAKGGDLQVKDDNLPKPVVVGTNKPGDKPDLLHTFKSGQDSIADMKVHTGMKVNLFADEKQFPELVNPVQMAWDTKGRLWVAAWTNYPERTPTGKIGDKLIVLEDTDGNGQADKCTTFLDDLNGPTGFQFYKDGVLVMQAPDLWFVRDVDGDGKADTKERILMGLDSADSHHQTNAMCLDPAGAVYLSDGVFHRTQVETAYGITRNNDAAIFRFEPNTGKFETYAAYGFANPHGRVFDGWGNDFITDATGNNTYFGAAISGQLDYPSKHPRLKEFWKRPSRPCPGTGWLSSGHFPEEFQDNFLNCNVISFQGIFRVKVSQDGSGPKGETLEDIVSSTDPNFRPSQVNVGPDGALYFADWSNAIIGHMQHHLRDPNRDQQHGRVYRITHEGRPLLKPAKIHGQPIEALLELLKEHETGTRELAKIELGKHDSAKVAAAAKKWIAGLNRADKGYEHQRLEGLWVHQWHNVVDADLLKAVLASPEPRARAAAVRVLTYWRDRVPDALALLKTAANDEDPRVRLFAARGASFFKATGAVEAVDVVLAAASHSTDEYLDYVITESLRHLEPVWRKAISEGKALASGSPAGLRFLLEKLKPEELVKLPQTPEVLAAIISRSGFSEAQRIEALMNLATAKKSTAAAELLNALEPLAREGKGSAADLARLLARQPAADLKPLRDRLVQLTRRESVAAVRQGAFAAVVMADGSFEPSWTAAAKGDLVTLLNAVPMVADPALRGTIRDKALALVNEQKKDSAAAGASGRYVRIELPRKGTLTLAEVQVMSGGSNIAGAGKASQSSTSNGGVAARAIDGKTDGAFGSGTQTHTKENENNPWWELDLGSVRPIDSIIVWNRSEGNGQYAKRLDGFTVRVLDAGRHAAFEKASIPAPAESATVAVSSDQSGATRRAAITAFSAAGGDPAATFTALTRVIESGSQVQAAALALRSLPRAAWPKDQAALAARGITAWAKSVPAGERTTPEYVATVQFAGDLTSALPAAEAAELRKALKEVRVAVFVVKAVHEQMRFDTTRLVVEAGKPFEIIVENPDAMPHNLVVVKPGTREKIGMAATTMPPTKLDSQGRSYVPSSPDVIGATKLLEPGQKETLKLKAPATEGEYEYVCTFPGHWMIMWGKLVVTKDVDGYLATHPETAPATTAAATHAH